MAAEAYNRGDISDSQARIYLNLVRDRAFNDMGSGAHDINLSGTALTDAIWNERRLELAGEGHRFFDQVRTNQTSEIVAPQAGQFEKYVIKMNILKENAEPFIDTPNTVLRRLLGLDEKDKRLGFAGSVFQRIF